MTNFLNVSDSGSLRFEGEVKNSGNVSHKRIDSLYLLKAIASFFVVLIHTDLFGRLALYSFAGVGTPIFYCITGYLLYSNDLTREIVKSRKWALKAFLISIACSIIYAVFYFIIGIRPEVFTDISIWYTSIFLNGGDGICFSLWYLTAMWQGLLIFLLLRKFFPKLIYLLPFIFILLYLIRNANEGALYDFTVIDLPRNSLLTSLTFLATGYLIRKHYTLLSSIPVIPLFIVFCLTSIVETAVYFVFFNHASLFHFSTYPLILLTILLCLKFKDFRLPLLNEIGRKHSPNIYYFHMIFVMSIGLTGWKIDDVLAIVVWVVCIPVSILVNYVTSFFKSILHKFKLKLIHS